MKEGRKDFWVQKTGGVYLILLLFQKVAAAVKMEQNRNVYTIVS